MLNQHIVLFAIVITHAQLLVVAAQHLQDGHISLAKLNLRLPEPILLHCTLRWLNCASAWRVAAR